MENTGKSLPVPNMKGARRGQGADMNSRQDFDRQQRVGCT